MDKKLTPAEIVIVASGLALFVFSFFDYYSQDDFDYSLNAWDEFPLFTSAALFGLVAAVQILATKLGGVNAPSQVMGFSWPQIHLVLGIFALLNMLGIFLAAEEGIDTGIGLIIGLLASIGLVVGAVLLNQEATGRRPTAPPQY